MSGGVARVTATSGRQRTRVLLRDLPPRAPDRTRRPRGERPASCSCSPAPSRTRSRSTSRRGRPWCGSASVASATRRPTSPPSTSSRPRLAGDPERDDPAQPEAVTIDHRPRLVGSAPRRGAVRRPSPSTPGAPRTARCSGSAGPSAPYWELRGHRPSVALVVPKHGPQLLRRATTTRPGCASAGTATTCGWRSSRPTRPGPSTRARRERLREGARHRPRLPAPVSWSASPSRVDGHCYKVCSAVLPRG